MAPMVAPLLGKRATPVALLAIRGGGGDASALLGLTSATAALTKAVVGLGVLTLANGISSGTGVGPATIAMATTTAVGAYTFSLVGELCELSGLGAASTFQSLWVSSIGESSLWMLQSAIISLCFALCTVYLLCLGELLPPLFTLARGPAPLRSRRPCVLIGAAAVLPLCLQSSLSGLSFASLLGASAVALTCLFLVTRWQDGSYARGGRFFDRMPPALQANVEGSPAVWQVTACDRWKSSLLEKRRT
jgi:amino acid permease